MESNPFEPGASVMENVAVGIGAPGFETPRVAIVYALYATIGVEALQLAAPPVFVEGGEADLTAGLLALAQFLLLVVCAVLWCQWKMRAARNIRVFGDGPFEFTPGWAAGWYFVPFANLVKPFQAAREILIFSKPDSDGAIANTSLLGVWWGAWLASNFLANISSRIEESAAAQISSVASILAAVLAIRLVRRINDDQLRSSQEVALRGS